MLFNWGKKLLPNRCSFKYCIFQKNILVLYHKERHEILLNVSRGEYIILYHKRGF